MGNDRKYVKFDYTIDEPYCNFDELEIIPVENDEFFNEIEFKDKIVTLYFKEDFVLKENQTVEELEKYAENKLFAIMIEIVKETNAKNPKTKIDESHIGYGKIFHLRATCINEIYCSVKLDMCKPDGTFVTEEENRKIILQNNKNKMQEIIANSNSNLNIQDKDKEKFIKIFKIEDPIIKYFVLYSWLVDLCGTYQKPTEQFIKSSPTFEWIGKITKVRKKDNGTEVVEDIFTHLRNLIGHSINDVLTINDENIVKQVEQYTNPLIKIILEKLNESEE